MPCLDLPTGNTAGLIEALEAEANARHGSSTGGEGAAGSELGSRAAREEAGRRAERLATVRVYLNDVDCALVSCNLGWAAREEAWSRDERLATVCVRMRLTAQWLAAIGGGQHVRNPRCVFTGREADQVLVSCNVGCCPTTKGIYSVAVKVGFLCSIEALLDSARHDH
jgi:hypothetical protein